MEPSGTTTPMSDGYGSSPSDLVPSETSPVIPPLPPIILPSAFETKPGKDRPSFPVRKMLVVLLVIFVCTILALYFWGASLANSGT